MPAVTECARSCPIFQLNRSLGDSVEENIIPTAKSIIASGMSRSTASPQEREDADEEAY